MDEKLWTKSLWRKQVGRKLGARHHLYYCMYSFINGPSTAVTGTANNDSLVHYGGSDHFFRIQRSVCDWIDIGNISCQILFLSQTVNYLEGNRNYRFRYITRKITMDVQYAVEQCRNGTTVNIFLNFCWILFHFKVMAFKNSYRVAKLY